MEHDDHHDDPPVDETTPGPGDESTPGPSDEANPGPADEATSGPGDDATPGRDDESTPGPADDATPGPADDADREPAGPDGPTDGDAPTPPERICRRCSTVAATTGDFCPHCGASYVRRRTPWGRLGRRGRRITVAVVLVALLGGGGAGAVLKVRADDRAEQREQAARDRREAAARAERAREERESAEAAAAQEAADEEERLQRRLRTFTVRELRTAVTKDARGRHAEGVLEDRANSTSCENTDGNEDDLGEDSAEYSCIAVTETDGDGGSRGYRFSARVDFEEGSFTWRLGGD